MKLFRSIIVLLIIMILVVGCKNKSDILTFQDLLVTNDYSPKNGIEIKKVREQISEHMGFDNNFLVVVEITDKRLWVNNGVQIFRVKSEHKSIDSIVIYREGELLDVLRGQNILAVILADLDSDNEYEICVKFTEGFGYIRDKLLSYDFRDNIVYKYDLEDDELLAINFEENKIDVFRIGKLKEKIIKQNDSGVVEIEFEKKYLGVLKIIDSEIKILN